MSWITVLDYRTGTVLCEEVNDEKIDNMDEYVDNMFRHNDYHYMSSNALEITIKELDNENQTIITKH